MICVGASQRVDIEIVDSSPRRNVYLSKRGVSGETRLAVTSHADGDIGVCFKNHLDSGMSELSLDIWNSVLTVQSGRCNAVGGRKIQSHNRPRCGYWRGCC